MLEILRKGRCNVKRILSLVMVLTFILSSTVLASTSPPVHQHKWEYVLSDSSTMYYVDVNKENILLPQNNIMVFYTKNYNKDKNVTIITRWALKTENKKIYARTEWGKIIQHSTQKVATRSKVDEWSEFERKSILSQCVLYLIKNTEPSEGAAKK